VLIVRQSTWSEEKETHRGDPEGADERGKKNGSLSSAPVEPLDPGSLLLLLSARLRVLRVSRVCSGFTGSGPARV